MNDFTAEQSNVLNDLQLIINNLAVDLFKERVERELQRERIILVNHVWEYDTERETKIAFIRSLGDEWAKCIPMGKWAISFIVQGSELSTKAYEHLLASFKEAAQAEDLETIDHDFNNVPIV